MNVAARDDPFAYDLALAMNESQTGSGEAFERLFNLVRPASLRMLVRRGAAVQDAEDAVQAAFVELWRTRSGLRARTGGEWYALVRRSVSWAYLGKLRKESRDAERAEDWGLSDADRPALDAVLGALVEGWLHQAADGLWLGAADARHATRGAAAVQLYLLHDVGEDEAAATFGASREEFEGWLGDPSLVARALFSSLCWSGDDLAGYVLRPEHPLSSSELDALMRDRLEPSRIAGWSVERAKIVCWRLRNGLREDEIGQASGGASSPGEIEAVLREVRDALPYADLARGLRRRLEQRGSSRALSESGLWKRMAFEYSLREMSQRQILELEKPPADIAPFPISFDQLNNWIGGQRLVRQLASYVRREEGK